MNESSDPARDNEGPPTLDSDGETILIPLHGEIGGVARFHAVRSVRPGDPDYDDLLSRARANAGRATFPARAPDPERLAQVRRDAGLS
ncbi:MAG: hypothetical protein HOQ24_07295 [Mycobacteriaceae bacterium]|nr:hypothetical protein [Mycobacteriaceae bacterium]